MHTFWRSLMMAAMLGLAFSAYAEDEAPPPAPDDPSPAVETPEPGEIGTEETRLTDLKRRYRQLRERKERLEAEIDSLESESADVMDSGDERDDGEDKTTARAPRGLEPPAGKASGPNAQSNQSERPKKHRTAAPPEERLERLSARVDRIDEQLRTIEDEAAELGIGSAGLMQGSVDE